MQEKCELEYEKFKNEISDIHTKSFNALSLNPELLLILKGWKVFYSPLLYKPKVLFIGINPGGGESGVYDCEHTDKGELEYLHYDYTLARETKEVFKNADRYELLFNAVKINYYYLATSNVAEMFKLTDFLGRGSVDHLGEQIMLNARKWTKRLIEIMEPEIIVCEGAEAYANVTDLFINRIKMEENVENIFVEEINAQIIGYKRIYSNIKGKVKLSEVLANLTKNTEVAINV